MILSDKAFTRHGAKEVTNFLLTFDKKLGSEFEVFLRYADDASEEHLYELGKELGASGIATQYFEDKMRSSSKEWFENFLMNEGYEEYLEEKIEEEKERDHAEGNYINS